MADFMFQNVAFRATVYRTGEVGFTQFIFMYIQHDSVTTGIIPKKFFNKNCQWQDLIKKQFLNDCKDCKPFCKFEVILSRFIYGAYFEFYGCFLWMIIFQIDLRESIGNFRSQANLKPINLTRWRTLLLRETCW